MPQGDASAAPAPAPAPDPNAAPVPGADMSADASGTGFDPMGADPNMGAGIGNVANGPDAGMPAGDPGMEGEDAGIGDPGMEGGAEGGIDDDSTASIIDQLSDEDKEAVRNYAESLLNRDEAAPEGDMAGTEEPAAPGQAQGGVMMEISKGRLKKVQQRLSETFRDNSDEKNETERRQKKVNNDFKKKTPFDTPLD